LNGIELSSGFVPQTIRKIILGLHIQTARCKHLVQFVIDKHKCYSLQNMDYTESNIIN